MENEREEGTSSQNTCIDELAARNIPCLVVLRPISQSFYYYPSTLHIASITILSHSCSK